MNRSVFEITLSQIMRQNQEDKPRNRTRSGLLDSHRLPFYELTDKVFKKRKQEKKGKNYFISILMDASGSMVSSRRVLPCFDAVDKLCLSLQRVPGIHFEIVGFNTLEIKYKDYGEKYDSKMVKQMYLDHCGCDKDYRNSHSENNSMMVLNRTTHEMKIGMTPDVKKMMKAEAGDWLSFTCTHSAAENHDSFAVYNSYLRAKEREGRKVLLVFSDGEPTFHDAVTRQFRDSAQRKSDDSASRVRSINGDTRLATFIETVVKTNQGEHHGNLRRTLLKRAVALSKREGVDTIGIGIDTQAVAEYYQHWGSIDNPDDIFPETIRQLTKVFRKD